MLEERARRFPHDWHAWDVVGTYNPDCPDCEQPSEPYLSLSERGLRTPFDRAVDRAAEDVRQALREAREEVTRHIK